MFRLAWLSARSFSCRKDKISCCVFWMSSSFWLISTIIPAIAMTVMVAGSMPTGFSLACAKPPPLFIMPPINSPVLCSVARLPVTPSGNTILAMLPFARFPPLTAVWIMGTACAKTPPIAATFVSGIFFSLLRSKFPLSAIAFSISDMSASAFSSCSTLISLLSLFALFPRPSSLSKSPINHTSI